MPQASQTSCPLCLRAYDPDGLIDIALPHHAFLPESSVKLCQECCAAVLETCVKRHNEAPPSYTGADEQAAEPDAGANSEAESE